jgi:hypothetical protein
MSESFPEVHNRLDRAGIMLSGLCAAHCLLGVVLVSVLGLGSQLLLTPAIHRYGLALAIIIGLITLGLGTKRHGQLAPLLIGGTGLVLMALGLIVPHGVPEAALTVCGVALVAIAHLRNLRLAC